ncbi:tyrosine-type recombinase/integrase [Paenibacillus sp. FSL H7-0690]|uniref:tyrosine-type recombinase/integrase n=1 Tax=Paenibacillus sp. FSL H7-0690 TaxID=2921437 RepID=UPI0030EEEC32
MAIEHKSNYDYYEISKELNIPYEIFMEFIKNNNGSDQSLVFQTSDITLREAINQYLINLKIKVKIKKRSEETYKTYKSFLDNFCLFMENANSAVQIGQINEIHLNDFILTTKFRGTKPSLNSTNTYTGILRDFIEFCLLEKWIYHDFRTRFEVAAIDLLPRYIPYDQVEALLRGSVQMINGYRNHAILSVLVGTGLRISELLALRIKDIHLESKLIYVEKGKGNKERYVTLYKEVEDIFLDFLNLTNVKDLKTNPDGFIFATDTELNEKRKKPITKNAVEKMMKRLRLRLGIEEKYTPHSLRHTFAVRCMKKGMTTEYLSQILGHNDPRTTYIYMQLLPQDLGVVLTEKFPFPFPNLLFRSLGVTQSEINQ